MIHPRQSKEKARSGFSLFETVMGTAVMSLVLAGVFSGLTQAAHLTDRARSEQFVTQVLQNEIVELKAESWNTISSLSSVTYDYRDTQSHLEKYFTDPVPVLNLTYNRSVESLNAGKQRRITIEMEWVTMAGQKLSREIAFTYTQGGVYDAYTTAL
ncbi:MAG: hypothetical protein ACFE0O_12820 [Opitutales bacterium]